MKKQACKTDMAIATAADLINVSSLLLQSKNNITYGCCKFQLPQKRTRVIMMEMLHKVEMEELK